MSPWLLLANAVVILLFMTAAFLVAYHRKRVDTVDAAWGLGFIVPTSLAFGFKLQLSTVVVGILVYLWSVRLTTHLIERNRDRPDDPRYKDMSKRWGNNFWQRAYVSVFLLQGALIWLISLPIILATGKPLRYVTVVAGIGAALWLAGFVLEALADRQLALFMRTKKRPGSTLQSGLWRYSRHPNYFGELCQWFGVALVALGVHNGWIGLIGPVILTVLIVFISGIPPIEQRRKGDKEYQSYRQRTSVLIPWPPKQKA